MSQYRPAPKVSGDGLGNAFEPVEIQSVVDVVTKQILGLISTGVLKTGDRLPSEAELASRLRVGRSTVREVKQILGSWGFLRFEGTRGCFIAEPPPNSGDSEIDALVVAVRHGSSEDLHEARTIIDTGVIRLVSARITSEQVASLGRLLDDLAAETNDPQTFFTRAMEFHALLTSYCGNPILEEFYHLITEIALTEQLPDYQQESDPHEVLALHRKLLTAVATRDPDFAAAEMIEHLDESHHKTEQHAGEVHPAEQKELSRS